MNSKPKMLSALSPLAAAGLLLTPAAAQAKDPPVELTKCAASYGTIALVDGDTQGWSEFGLGSPRQLISALAVESGCFTPYNAATGKPADFLLNAIAGKKEEVDQSISTAKAVAAEGLVRSGAAGAVLGKVPMGGQLLGAFSAFGGKKKVVAAGLRLISPANGQTLIMGQGEVKKTSISFGGGTAWDAGASAAGYGGSKEGQMLVEAFVKAFNVLSGQGDALTTYLAASQPQPAPAAAPAAPAAAQ